MAIKVRFHAITETLMKLLLLKDVDNSIFIAKVILLMNLITN